MRPLLLHCWLPGLTSLLPHRNHAQLTPPSSTTDHRQEQQVASSSSASTSGQPTPQPGSSQPSIPSGAIQGDEEDKPVGVCKWRNVNGQVCGDKIAVLRKGRRGVWGRHCQSKHQLPDIDETGQFTSNVTCRWEGCSSSNTLGTLDGLAVHLISHLGFEKWKCDQCGGTFSRGAGSYVSRHRLTCKGPSEGDENTSRKKNSKKRRVA